MDPATARQLFQRVLGSWASDLLELRRRGLDRPGYRPRQDEAMRQRGAA